MTKPRVGINAGMTVILISLVGTACVQQGAVERRVLLREGNTKQQVAEEKSEDKATEEVKVSFYQLVLLSEKAPANAPPGMKYHRVRKASAREVGEMVQQLVVPSGPVGREHRYTLLYRNQQEIKKACAWADEFDVAAQSTGDVEKENDLREGVRLLYEAQDKVDYQKGNELVRRVLERLKQAINNENLENGKRWAAGMIAADLLIHKRYEYHRAAEIYRELEKYVTPGSYEQMLTWYKRARVMESTGRKDSAQRLVANMIAQFDQFSQTEVYRRGRLCLAELKR